MKNIAIIPARSGSKGLKDKNIKELSGIPMLAYSIKVAQESGLFDEIMVSTDSIQYAEIAKQYGAQVPFLRSEKQSSDTAGSWDVVSEVLEQYLDVGKQFETVCLLQPTSPLRIAEDIKNGYFLLEQKNAEAITAVCEMDHSPLWATTLSEDSSLKAFREKLGNIISRQKLEMYYRINGALYIRKVKYVGDTVEILDMEEYAYVMDRERSVDIDTELDFLIAERLLKQMNSQ